MHTDEQSGFASQADERNSYNTAFHELGFDWHWDDATYERLVSQGGDASQRLLHYLHAQHPHLLTAYSADFLVDAVQHRVALHAERTRPPLSAG